MIIAATKNRRVIVVSWKNKSSNTIEVYSNLKNFCSSYQQFNYNTLNNYISKAKVAYENQEARIERKTIISKPVSGPNIPIRKIAPVVRKAALKDANDEERDLEYWLSRTVKERAAAVTDIIMQSVKKGERLDKSKRVKKYRI